MMKEPKLHLVQLDENILYRYKYLDNKSPILYANIKNHIFKGYLVNFSASALYFEPEDRNGLIIVPHAWVKWCVPVEEDLKEGF